MSEKYLLFQSFFIIFVAVIGTHENPMFAAKDICNILGLSNSTISLRNIPDKWKGANKLLTPSGEQDMLTVTEAGLYKLVMRSTKPIAEKFQEWICEDVLPSIRKKGEYVLEEYKKKIEEQQKQLELKSKEVEEKTQALSNEQKLVVSLKKSHAKLTEKNHFYYDFREMPCVYIISNPDIPVKKFKIGYTDNMNVRLKADRTMAPNLRVEFLMYTPHAVLFEKLIKTKYRRKLESLNHEWVVEYLENLIKFYRDIDRLMEFDGIEEINVWQYNLDHEPRSPVQDSIEQVEEKKEEPPKPRETKKSVVKFNLDLKEDVLQERLKKILPYFLTKTDYIEKNKKAPAGKRFCNGFCQQYLPLSDFMISEKGVIPLCKNCQDLEDKAWIKINNGELTEQQIRENPLLISCSKNEKICRICKQVKSLDQYEEGKKGDHNRRQCKTCRRQMDKERWETFDIEAASRKIFQITDKVQMMDFINLYPKDRLVQIISKLGIGRSSSDKKSDMIEKTFKFFVSLQETGKNIDTYFLCK